MAAKKKASAKRGVKKAPARRPAKRATKRVVKKSSKRPAKKAAAKRPAKRSKRSAKKASGRSDLSKIVIPPVPSRGSTSLSSTPTPAKAGAPTPAPTTKRSNNLLFLVIAGVVLLAIFALTNSSSDDDATTTLTEIVEPMSEPSESESEEPAISAYEAPLSFVAINNGNGGVTLRWKAPGAIDGLTGYAISVSYNAKDFTEVSTVGADQFSFDIALAGDDGGTQFLLQSIYSDGTKVDAAKFSLKGKYSN